MKNITSNRRSQKGFSNRSGLLLSFLAFLLFFSGRAGAQTITLSTASLESFGSQEVGTVSSPKTFSVTASGLTAEVVITAPEGFEVRLSGTTTFTCGTVAIAPQNGGVASKTVEVRFIPTSSDRAYSANVGVASTGATTQNVAVSGTSLGAVYPPTIGTVAVTGIGNYGATCGGTECESPLSEVTSKGLVWSTKQNPTLLDSKADMGGGLAAFSRELADLKHSTTYYVRAYATNGAGTSYGEQFTFTTSVPDLAAEPTTPSTIAFSNVTSNSLVLSLNGGDGNKKLVLIKEGAAVDATPTDREAYAADAAFKKGQELGSGNYVVYNGGANEVTVSGLTVGTTYHFAVFEYAEGNGLGTENYLTTAAGRASQQTSATVGGLLFEENFDYPEGTALTEKGWTAHSGTSGAITVSSANLVYDFYSSSSGNAAVMNVNGQDVSKKFGPVQRSTPVFVAFLVNVASAKPNGEYFFHLGPQNLGSTFRAKVHVRSGTGGVQFGISGAANSPDAVYTQQEYAVNQTHLLVVRYDFTSSGNVTKLYVNPELGVEPATAQAVDTQGSSSPTEIGTVALRQGTNFPELTIDGIRIATSYAEAAKSTVLGLPKELAASNANVYPNPATSTLQVQVKGAGKGVATIKLFDTVGRPVLVQEEQIAGADLSASLDVSKVARGNYFLVVQTAKGVVRRHVVLQ
ncbi:T9SS type A sorting domain-containing protein [Rufibacter roseus]|uniref:T9SS type A sorting domain-containing protein n=1 Tax=Rufibacter roseus TaxID=1567108 RepID=A0ABW2DP34_9BACT|nr:T9SS type A sorting domain-containing protein [Rufibacter roseus]